MREKEQKAAVTRLHRLDPEFTISKFLGLIRLSDKNDETRLAGALRKAGLAE